MELHVQRPNKTIQMLLLLATGRGVSTSVLVSHVDSVSLVQLSWYLGSMMASARLPPQPIEKTIQGRCSSSSGPTRNDQRLDSCHTTILPASTPSASPFPCLVSPCTGCQAAARWVRHRQGAWSRSITQAASRASSLDYSLGLPINWFMLKE